MASNVLMFLDARAQSHMSGNIKAGEAVTSSFKTLPQRKTSCQGTWPH
jgi:hypothetical protein